jgi:hypothetical protein
VCGKDEGIITVELEQMNADERFLIEFFCETLDVASVLGFRGFRGLRKSSNNLPSSNVRFGS